LVLIFLFGGCVTGNRQQTITSESSSGSWTGKALIENKQSKKSQMVNLDLIAQQPSKLRLEVSATLGVSVATLALKDGVMAYMIPREKKFASGPARPAAFRNLIGIALAPADFMNLLFDRPLDPRVWVCSNERCRHDRQDLQIVWKEREGARRLIEISSSKMAVTLRLTESSSKVEPRPEIFELTPPNGFQVLNW